MRGAFASILALVLTTGAASAEPSSPPPEPDGYRMDAYRAPVPATLKGAIERAEENIYDALVKRIKEQSITEQVQTVNLLVIEDAAAASQEEILRVLAPRLPASRSTWSRPANVSGTLPPSTTTMATSTT